MQPVREREKKRDIKTREREKLQGKRETRDGASHNQNKEERARAQKKEGKTNEKKEGERL